MKVEIIGFGKMDWTPYIPPDDDVQVSRSTDFEACASYSFIHIIQILLKYKTGLFVDFSERAMAKLSDTQPWGNSIENIMNAAKQDGVILSSDWPELTHSSDYENINWATYYQTIPNAVLKRAFRLKATATKLTPTQVASALQKSPIWTIVKVSSGQNHIVAQINQTQFYDSYEIKIKKFSDGYPIQSQFLLTFNFLNMPNAQFYHKIGTNEYGFALPALSEDSLKDKAMNFGVSILKSDGTIDYSLAKEVSGF